MRHFYLASSQWHNFHVFQSYELIFGVVSCLYLIRSFPGSFFLVRGGTLSNTHLSTMTLVLTTYNDWQWNWEFLLWLTLDMIYITPSNHWHLARKMHAIIIFFKQQSVVQQTTQTREGWHMIILWYCDIRDTVYSCGLQYSGIKYTESSTIHDLLHYCDTTAWVVLFILFIMSQCYMEVR